jgi:hypothetical protein
MARMQPSFTKISSLAVVLLGATVSCGGKSLPIASQDGGVVDDASEPDVGVSCADCDSGVAPEAQVTDSGTDELSPTPTDAPRPLAPLSTSHVTSRRPTLRWALPSGVYDATVDLCADRACATPVAPPAHVDGSSYAPTQDLPVGAVFWRVHPSTTTSVSSPTWELFVGGRSAPVDTSWGSTFDVDGDGYADLAVGASGQANSAGSVEIHLGSRTGVASTPAVTLPAPDSYYGPGGYFGESLTSAGDVNGDGYADLLALLGSDGSAYVYLGGATGLNAGSKVALQGLGGTSGVRGLFVESAGDINADGYADVVVQTMQSATGPWQEQFYLYAGGPTGLVGSPIAVTYSVPEGDASSVAESWSVGSAGDVNGDGYSDVVVATYGTANPGGALDLYLNGPIGIATTSSGTVSGFLPGPASESFCGVHVVGAADVNGDGYADFVVTSSNGNAPTAAVIFGTSTGLAAAAETLTIPGSLDPANLGCGAGAMAGDVNGDGYGDFVFSASTTGNAYLYLGGPQGLASSPSMGLTGSTQMAFGAAVSSAGDVNGDGRADLCIGASGDASTAWSASVYLGSTTGVATQPASTFQGGVTGDGTFFLSVFGATN